MHKYVKHLHIKQIWKILKLLNLKQRNIHYKSETQSKQFWLRARWWLSRRQVIISICRGENRYKDSLTFVLLLEIYLKCIIWTEFVLGRQKSYSFTNEDTGVCRHSPKVAQIETFSIGTWTRVLGFPSAVFPSSLDTVRSSASVSNIAIPELTGACHADQLPSSVRKMNPTASKGEPLYRPQGHSGQS